MRNIAAAILFDRAVRIQPDHSGSRFVPGRPREPVAGFPVSFGSKAGCQ